MTIHRAAVPAPQTNLFESQTKDWNAEIKDRAGWSAAKKKTVEAAKDKGEGLKARAKGKRGGDASRGNYSTFAFDDEDPPLAVSARRNYAFMPTQRNPLMAGNMKPEEYRPGVKQVDPPREKVQPKTHKVVNIAARNGSLKEKGESSFSVLAGAGEKPKEEVRGRKGYGNFNAETMPPPQRPSGRGGRKEERKTDPFKYEREADETPAVNTRAAFAQRYQSTPERRTHTFEAAIREPRYPGYKINPPYSVEA